MCTYTLHITGMICDHCVRTAEDALNALPGVWAEVSHRAPQGERLQGEA